MQAVTQCQAHFKPRGGDITSKRKDVSANQKPEEEWKYRKRLDNNNNNGRSHVWTDKLSYLHWNIELKKTQQNALWHLSSSVLWENRCTFKFCWKDSDECYFGRLPLPLLPQEIRSHKQTLHRKDDVKQKGQVKKKNQNSFLYTKQSFLKSSHREEIFKDLKVCLSLDERPNRAVCFSKCPPTCAQSQNNWYIFS